MELDIESNWNLTKISISLKKYPWKIYSQFYFFQIIAYNFLLLGFVLFIKELLPLALYFFLGSLLVSLYTAYLFTKPIHRIYLRMLRIVSKKNNPGLEFLDEDLTEDEYGEYSELEYGLTRIQKKLKKRKDQLQREREETEAFMSSVQEGLISISRDEKVLFFNSQFATLFLDSNQLKMENLFLTDVFRVPVIYETFIEVLKSGVAQKLTVKMETKLDSIQKFYLISLTPLRKYKSNEIYGMIGSFHDIHDLKKTEQIRIDFVANASHELRTPLTSIKGYIDTLKSDFKNGEISQAGQFIETISRNTDRLIELVNDLLSLSSLESNPELKIEKIIPMQLSDMIISELVFLAKEKNQLIKINCHLDYLFADAQKVEQVLRNLLLNAIKYIPNDKVINIVWDDDGEGNGILRVIDNGPGIPKEHHDRLFERFYRIDKGRTRDQGGTGLGLAIVKHIMQTHGGSISLKSNLGEGSEFICIFPNRNR